MATPALGELTITAAATAGWRAWRGPLLLALATVVALRLVLGLCAAFVLGHFPVTGEQTAAIAKGFADAGLPAQAGGWAAPWERQDAIWYERIALNGYAPDATSAFFPLLPLLMRLASPLTGGNVAVAGLLVGALASVAAFALLYRLAARDTTATTAGRTVAYLALFPTAFFLYAAYTESLFLALALGAFWHARAGRWFTVAGLVALAGLTHIQGALLGVPLAAEYLVAEVRFAPQPDGRRTLAAVAAQMLSALQRGLAPLVPDTDRAPALAAGETGAARWRGLSALAAVVGAGGAATLGFFAYRSLVIQDPVSWSAREAQNWQQRATWPGETLWFALQTAFSGHASTIDLFDVVVLLGFTGLGVAAWRMRPSYGLYTGLILATSWLYVNEELPLMNAARFVLTAFPCFLVLAIWAGRRPRWVHLLIIALWVSWLLVWASEWVRGYWVG